LFSGKKSQHEARRFLDEQDEFDGWKKFST